MEQIKFNIGTTVIFKNEKTTVTGTVKNHLNGQIKYQLANGLEVSGSDLSTNLHVVPEIPKQKMK